MSQLFNPVYDITVIQEEESETRDVWDLKDKKGTVWWFGLKNKT
jgi:hypothetical protein